jgi:hypothetical protein
MTRDLKRLLNAYWMLGYLPAERLRVDADQSHALTQLEETTERPEVDRLAATNGSDRVAVASWHHCVDPYLQGTAVPAAPLPYRSRPLP